MTSGSKWEGEEGGDEDVEQEEELGGVGISIIIISSHFFKFTGLYF